MIFYFRHVTTRVDPVRLFHPFSKRHPHNGQQLWRSPYLLSAPPSRLLLGTREASLVPPPPILPERPVFCRSPLPPARHDACFLLANAQFRYYLTLKSYQAAVDGLLTSLSAHLPSLTAIYDAPGMGKMRCHSMATQVEFRYHLGKYRLGLRRIPEVSRRSPRLTRVLLG